MILDIGPQTIEKICKIIDVIEYRVMEWPSWIF